MSTLRSNVRQGIGYPKDNTLASLDVMVRPAKGIPPQVVPHHDVYRACHTMAQRDEFLSTAESNVII